MELGSSSGFENLRVTALIPLKDWPIEVDRYWAFCDLIMAQAAVLRMRITGQSETSEDRGADHAGDALSDIG